MARSLQFMVDGPIQTLVTVEEVMGTGGNIELKVTVAAQEVGGLQADLRGVFFDVEDDSLLANMTVDGADVTDSQFAANAVDNLGNGANVKGHLTKKGNDFDAGVEIGTQGIGKDDIDTTMFTLAVAGQDLTLDDLGGERIALRYTSFGYGEEREGSLKLGGLIPHAPDAVDDSETTDEDTAVMLNLLANDTDEDGDTLSVTAVNMDGGNVGTSFAVTSDGGRTGLLTVNADGSTTFDPDDGFEDLSTGDTDTVNATYTISDGDGGEDWANLTITVTGVNDAPVANDDGSFFVEFGDTATVDVLANDTDVDGTIDPTTLLFSGADNGTAVNASGQLQYTADNPGYDTTNDSVNDDLSYTVEDNEGAVSNSANVTANVIDPLRETNTDSVTTSSGQTISLALSTEDRTFNDSSFVEVDITASQLTGNDVNVVFIWDGSGSLNSSEYATELNAIQTTLNALDAEFAGSATDVDVKLIQFSREPAGGNGIRESGVFDLDDPALDNVAALPVASQLGGGTDYAPPINAAFSFLNSEPAGEENFVFFASDGQPNFGTNFGNIGGLQAIADVQAFGFGSGVTSGSAINALNTVDSDNAVILPGASDLANAFATSPLFAADLVDFSLKVEGFEIANKGNLVPLGTGNFEFDDTLTSLLNGLGDSTTVEATATFDTDNDGSADETLVAQTIINGTDGSDIIFA